MWPFPNPFDLFGSAVSSVVGWAWDKVIQGIYTWFASGILMLMEWVWGVLDTATTPRLTEDWFATGLVQPLAGIALAITVALMLASAIQAGFGGRPELIVDAVKEGPKAIVATALTVVVMDILVRGADAISAVTWAAGKGDTQRVLDSVAGVMTNAGALAGTFLGPLALLFGMIGLLMTTLVLFMRSALLYLVAAFAPIVWSSSVSPVMRGSGRRLVHIAVALVLAKPAITITLIVGTKLLANAGAPGTDGAAALGTLVTGFACFAIAGLSPWVVYRLLPTVEQATVASGVVGGWGRAAMTAAQAGMMAKSLGASAATRSVPAMASAASTQSGSGSQSTGGSAGSSPTPSSGSAASSSAGGVAGRRPPIPPAPAPSPPAPGRPSAPRVSSTADPQEAEVQ